MKFFNFFLLLWVTFALLNPDPLTRLNPDPIGIRIRNPVFFSDSLVEVAEEDWCTRLSAALTTQLSSFYEPESLEKAFALRALGHVTRLLTSDQLILDNLSALYLAVTHIAMESACAKAFGNFKKFLVQNIV
jgi:hypothetical protein